MVDQMSDLAILGVQSLLLLLSLAYFLEEVSYVLKEVYIYVNAKINIYMARKLDKNEMMQKKSQAQGLKNEDLSIFSLPIFQVLSVVEQTKQKKLSKNSVSKVLWSATISITICLIIPFLLIWSYKVIQLSQQVYFLWENLKEGQINQIVYRNYLPDMIYLAQVTSNFLLIAFLMILAQSKSTKTKTLSFQFIQITLCVIIITINPVFVSIYLLKILTSFTSQHYSSALPKVFHLVPFIIPFTIIFLCIQEYNCGFFTEYYSQLLFQSNFLPQTNLMWIFYSHMFNRYLTMYQLIFFVLPISAAVPLALLQINHQTKVLIQYFIVIFTSYHCSYLNLYIFWLLCVLCLPNFSSYKNSILAKINKSLGFVAFIGSTFFFFTYQKLTQSYLNSWMVNIGYPFVFGCIAWTLISIWLVELLRIQLDEIGGIPYQQNDSKNKSIVKKIGIKINTLFKFKL